MERNFLKKENNTNILQKCRYSLEKKYIIPGEQEYLNIFSIYIITYLVQEGVTY